MSRAAETYDAHFAANIRRVLVRAREEMLGETQAAFAKRFKTNQATISRWEKSGQITLKALLTLAPIARMTLDEIVHGDRSVYREIRAALDGDVIARGVEAIHRARSKNLQSSTVPSERSALRAEEIRAGGVDGRAEEGSDSTRKRNAPQSRPR